MKKKVLTDCPNDMHMNLPNFVFVFCFIRTDGNSIYYFFWQVAVQYSFLLGLIPANLPCSKPCQFEGFLIFIFLFGHGANLEVGMGASTPHIG